MSQVLLGGLIGAVGALIVRRIKEIRMYYTDSGTHDVLIAVCVSDTCVVDHTDVDGSVQHDVVLNVNDLVLGGRVAIKSGRMFIMRAEVAGMLSL